MPKEDPQAFLPLKTNWFHILLSLAAEEQHGYGIMQEVLDRTSGKVHLWPATLYGTLARLIDAGLIEESEERPAEELDDAVFDGQPGERHDCDFPAKVDSRRRIV